MIVWRLIFERINRCLWDIVPMPFSLEGLMIFRRFLPLLFLVMLVSSYSSAVEKTFMAGKTDFKVETIVKGLGVIWGLEPLNGDELLITERSGRVLLGSLKNGSVREIKNPPSVYAVGQGGLLDVKIHPDFLKNQLVYFTYSKIVPGGTTTALMIAKLTDNQLFDGKDLFVAKAVQRTSHHYGSRLDFDGNGHIFMTIGDRGVRTDAQRLDNHQGKVVRLRLDGTVPSDNPFVKQSDALDEIYSYGHRNAQGIYFDRIKKELWVSEHGPKGGDEINLVLPGRNYGWPVATHGREYSGLYIAEPTKPGTEAPIKVYVPSIAPSSLMIYRGNMFQKFRDDFFVGALSLTHLNHVRMKGRLPKEEHRYLEDLKKRIRNVVEGRDGSLLLATDGGEVLRISVP
jgi:glucose/arabinose dehydrogenase